jgi:elongation factor P--beta-lysine ligase
MQNWKRLRENPKLWEQFFVREKVIRATRQFFDVNGFHEVEVPLLIAHPPAEAYVDVFETKVQKIINRISEFLLRA